MVLNDSELDLTESRVLAELDHSDQPYPPRRMIERLRGEPGISEALVRAAIWYLIDRHEVELTPDRLLRRLDTQRRDELTIGAARQ